MNKVTTSAVLVCLLACSKPAPEAAPASSASAAVPSASATADPLSSLAQTDAGLSPALPLLDKLDYEGKHRGTATPTVEQTWDAFDKAGIKLIEKAQHVGGVFGALYCVGAKSDDDAFSVCEFTDAAAAKAGKDGSEKALVTIPNRTLVVNKTTLLTVRQPATKTPASEALTKKAIDAFKKL